MHVKMTVKVLGEPTEAAVSAVTALLPPTTKIRASGSQAIFVDAWFATDSLAHSLAIARRMDHELPLRHSKIDLIKVRSEGVPEWRTVLINTPASRTVNPATCRHSQVLTTGECTRCGEKVAL
jgi:hypothetical protein